jgi:hypothetical protein
MYGGQRIPRPVKGAGSRQYAERLVAHWPSDMAAEALQELRYGINRQSGYK